MARVNYAFILARLVLPAARPSVLAPFSASMQTIEFDLAPGAPYIEVNHLLKVTGISDSGGSAKAMVADGMVSVDGAVETRKTAKIRAGQVVTCGNVRIIVREAAAT